MNSKGSKRSREFWMSLRPCYNLEIARDERGARLETMCDTTQPGPIETRGFGIERRVSAIERRETRSTRRLVECGRIARDGTTFVCDSGYSPV